LQDLFLSVIFNAWSWQRPDEGESLGEYSMKRKLVIISVGVCLVTLAAVVSVSAQTGPIVRPALKHDVSRPLAEMVAETPPQPFTGPVIEIEAPLPGPPLPGSGAPSGPDSVLQTATLPLVNTVTGLNFGGVGANGYVPPDTNGSVGATQYMQITNVKFAVYDKTNGSILLGPALINTIWKGFGGDCETSGDGGDPALLWDKAGQRWVVSQLSGNYASWCMAVSQSSDATGSYYRYAFSSGGNLDDYPKLGVWPDAYYRSTNTFNSGRSFIGANACAFDRALMLTGGAANEICFQQNTSVFGLLPSDLDGSTAPPSGEPDFFVELLDTTHLGLFKFHVDFSNPANSTFKGPTSIAVASYNEASGIPQPSGGSSLDSLGDRLMFRLAYRNFGDHEALVVTHSVTAGSVVGTRWYEVRSPNGTPSLLQQGTFSPDSTYRWMGSVAMDQAGDIALGYSVSSSSVDPGIRYTGRVPSDPTGTMETEASLIEGTGVESGTSRWGDYSSMSVDTDDCTFWYTTEYMTSAGGSSWSTRIGSFKFSSCASGPDFNLSASPASQTVLQGNSTTYTATVTSLNGFNSAVSLTVSGCPANTTCTLNPKSVTPPANGTATSTLTVQTTSTTPLGTYTLTITGTSGSLTHKTMVTLVVVQPDFSLSATPSSQTIFPGGSTSYSVKVNPLNGYNKTVSLTLSGCPSGATCSISPSSAGPPYNPSTLSVSTPSGITAGNYTITIKGTDGTLTHTTTATLAVKDFSISATPSTRSVKRGFSTTYTATVTALNAFTGTVSLSVTGLPASTMGTFSPASLPGHGSSMLTVKTTKQTPVGAFTLTIKGTSGSRSHSTTVSLTVTSH
jgi:hypothetical protein